MDKIIQSLFNDLSIADACALSLPLIFMLLIAVVACAFVLILKERSELKPSYGDDKRNNLEHDDSQQASLLATNGDYDDDEHHSNIIGTTTTTSTGSSVVSSTTLM